MNADELKRQYRVADQMLSMYSVLRDRYARRALWLTLGIFGSSVVLCACTFLSDNALEVIGITPMGNKILLGAFSSLVLFLSIAELRVDWKERSQEYAGAAEKLSRLKARYRSALAMTDNISPEMGKELTSQYGTTMEGLPRIPDSKFEALKAYHVRKVRISQMIDSSPGCPVWFLRLRLFFEGCSTKRNS